MFWLNVATREGGCLVDAIPGVPTNFLAREPVPGLLADAAIQGDEGNPRGGYAGTAVAGADTACTAGAARQERYPR